MECIQVRSRLRLEVCRNNNWTSMEVGYWYPGWLCANPSLVEGRRSCLLVENKLIIAGVMLALFVNTLKTHKWNDHRGWFVSVNGVSPFLIITEVGWLSEDCKWAVALLCPETTTTIQQLNGGVRWVHPTGCDQRLCSVHRVGWDLVFTMRPWGMVRSIVFVRITLWGGLFK